MTIGESMRRARKNAGLTLQKLAFFSNSTTSFLSRLERDMFNPNIKKVIELSDVIGISIDDYIGRKGCRKRLKVSCKLTIGQSIQRTRESKGVSIDKLAEMTGYEKQELNKWEKDRQSPRLMVVIDIADALGVSIDELVGREVKDNG